MGEYIYYVVKSGDSRYMTVLEDCEPNNYQVGSVVVGGTYSNNFYNNYYPTIRSTQTQVNLGRHCHSWCDENECYISCHSYHQDDDDDDFAS